MSVPGRPAPTTPKPDITIPPQTPVPRSPAAPGPDQDLHDHVMTFGRHRGERLVRVPVSYLRFMVANRTPHADLAERELGRRGTVVPEVEITGHAMDRASLLCRHFWHDARKRTGEGLHAWLCRVAKEALDKGTPGGDGKIFYAGMKFSFSVETAFPVLKTVRPHHGKGLDGGARNVSESAHADAPATP